MNAEHRSVMLVVSALQSQVIRAGITMGYVDIFPKFRMYIPGIEKIALCIFLCLAVDSFFFLLSELPLDKGM